MAGPRQLVNPPAFTSRPYGLLTVVESRTPDGPHWQNGVTWTSHCGMGDTTYDECIAVTGVGAVAEPSTKSNNLDVTHRGATPFTVYTRFDCAPVGNEDARSIAIDALAQSEFWQVERAIWTGLADGAPVVYPHLAADTAVVDAYDVTLQTAATVVTGTAIDVVTGLGLLEESLAACQGGSGVIHVPLRLLPALVNANLVTPRPTRNGGTGQFTNQLQTVSGNLVAVGAGYSSTSPAGVAPGTTESWMYATGPVFLYRGDVRVNTVAESVNRSTNTVEMIAERTYVVGWECCHLGVLVSLNGHNVTPA